MMKNRIFVSAFILLSLSCGAQERVISLQECLESSHTGNPGVLDSQLDKVAAKAQRQEARSNWFPNVSFSSLGFHALNPMLRIGLKDVLGSGDAANNLRYYVETAAGLSGIDTDLSFLGYAYVAALNVTQPLFAGGRIANGNALADLNVEAADIKNNMALRDNDDKVVEKYCLAVSLAEKKKALQQGMDFVRSLEKDASAAFDAGLAKESDVLMVRLKVKELDSDMIKLRSGERLAKMDLFNYVGIPFSILGLDDMKLVDEFDGMLSPEHYYRDASEIAASLDESKLLEMSVKAKKLEKKMVLGEALPQVALGASLGYGKFIGDPRSNGLVYAVVKIPISDWGKTARKLQRYQCEVEKAENDRNYLDKQLALKVNKEWIELQAAWDEKESAAEAMSLSEKIELQKREEYEAGLCTMSELLQSQTDLQAARSTYADCRARYRAAVALWNKSAE